MTAVAAQAATSRLAKPIPGGRGIATFALTVSTAVTLVYVIGVIVRVRVRADEVEARLALGFSGREAVQPMARMALRAAMIPTVNGMMTVGLVQLPGMMTGQILAGSSPLLAIKYQLLVVFMQAVFRFAIRA
jgi:UDP-glucose/iron transport system permease protein